MGFATIKFVVEEFETLADWNFRELAFLYGMAVLTHGLSVIFFTKTWYMGWNIIRGELDRMRLRPMNTLFQCLAGDLNFYGITDLIPGVILFVYGCVSVDIFKHDMHDLRDNRRNASARRDLSCICFHNVLSGTFQQDEYVPPVDVPAGGAVRFYIYSADERGGVLSRLGIYGKELNADAAIRHGVYHTWARRGAVCGGLQDIQRRFWSVRKCGFVIR